ncbi:hypothetical protein BDK51DRAFT_49724 [Blyttiomyces helicus]|uniref:Uncharacterized protein n=1 Tax=Blyttiomyces helicus TaxID=388810 RepID=A0A4P9WPL1_9FUNG|nr:hypothetical protein BDK51DRAFT_49724 [Blyttiomyces helicus]|eukprot:RKO94265.1 hypothetical protein BDK51DRAFT_49724 [Blyttiomyces helicus]
MSMIHNSHVQIMEHADQVKMSILHVSDTDTDTDGMEISNQRSCSSSIDLVSELAEIEWHLWDGYYGSNRNDKLCRPTASEIAEFLIFHMDSVDVKDKYVRKVQRWALAMTRQTSTHPFDEWDRLLFVGCDLETGPDIYYAGDREVRRWKFKRLFPVPVPAGAPSMITVTVKEMANCAGVMTLMENQTPHPIKKVIDDERIILIIERLKHWKKSLSRPPICYDALDFFEDERYVTEEVLRIEFEETFKDVVNVAYVRSEALVYDAWCECDIDEYEDENPDFDLDGEDDFYVWRPRVRLMEDSISFPIGLVDRLASIRGSMWIKGRPTNSDEITRYRMFLCEINLPNIGVCVCCVIDLTEYWIDEKKVRVVDVGKEVFYLTDTLACNMQCMVVRMHNVDNIGEFFCNDNLVDKGKTNPFYRGLDVFDLPHAHWMRRLAKQRGTIVEAVIRAKTGRAGVYVSIPW